MSCTSCGSENLHKFGAEVAIHFSGRKNLDKPHVYASPELVVCMDCGFVQFALTEAELGLLRAQPGMIQSGVPNKGTPP